MNDQKTGIVLLDTPKPRLNIENVADSFGTRAAADEVLEMLARNLETAEGLKYLAATLRSEQVRRGVASMILDHVAIGLAQLCQKHFPNEPMGNLDAILTTIQNRTRLRTLSANQACSASGASSSANASATACSSAPGVHDHKFTAADHNGTGRSD